MSDHAFRQFADTTVAAHLGASQHVLGLRTIESWVYAGDVVDGVSYAQPLGQHGHIGNEAHVIHQLIARDARVATQH